MWEVERIRRQSRVAQQPFQAVAVISPPLIISKGEIDELVSKARKSLDDTLGAIDAGALESD